MSEKFFQPKINRKEKINPDDLTQADAENIVKKFKEHGMRPTSPDEEDFIIDIKGGPEAGGKTLHILKRKQLKFKQDKNSPVEFISIEKIIEMVLQREK